MKLKYGLVGAGYIGEHKHLAGYSGRDDIELSAVCDEFNLERTRDIADKYSIKNVYSDYIDMIQNGNLDLISICTPNYLHMPIIIEALNHGVNVHSEKPLALNSEEVQKIKKVLSQSEAKLVVGMNNRFLNEIQFCRDYIESGSLGEIYHMKCGWRRRRSVPGKGNWFTNRKLSGGGPMIDLGVHMFDTIMYLSDNWAPASIDCSTYAHVIGQETKNDGCYGERGNGVCDVEDFASGMVKFKNDASLYFEFSWASNIVNEGRFIEILGSKSGLYFNWTELKIVTTINGTVVDIKPDTAYPKNSTDEFDNVIKIVSGSVYDDYPNVEEALATMRLIDAGYLSSKKKEPIVLE